MIKQALVAVRRKHRRSLVIGLIMTLVLTLLVSTLTVQHTMEQLRKSIEGGIRAGFSLTSRRTSDIVPSSLAQKVSRLEGVKAHNYRSQLYRVNAWLRRLTGEFSWMSGRPRKLSWSE